MSSRSWAQPGKDMDRLALVSWDWWVTGRTGHPVSCNNTIMCVSVLLGRWECLVEAKGRGPPAHKQVSQRSRRHPHSEQGKDWQVPDCSVKAPPLALDEAQVLPCAPPPGPPGCQPLELGAGLCTLRVTPPPSCHQLSQLHLRGTEQTRLKMTHNSGQQSSRRREAGGPLANATPLPAQPLDAPCSGGPSVSRFTGNPDLYMKYIYLNNTNKNVAGLTPHDLEIQICGCL